MGPGAQGRIFVGEVLYAGSFFDEMAQARFKARTPGAMSSNEIAENPIITLGGMAGPVKRMRSVP